jgi:putative tricarboxylic transport membrane protein
MHPTPQKLIANPEKIGALFYLAVSIAYGVYTFKIPLTLLSQKETFNARTMPFILSILGALLSLLIIILPSAEKKKTETVKMIFNGLDWRRTGWMILLMTIYALAVTWLGFILSSIIFLISGFYILGECRIMMLLAASIPLVFVIWFLMYIILGMYIAPGEIFYLLGVIK